MFAGCVYRYITRSLQYNSSPQASPVPLPTYVWVYAGQHLTNIIIVNMVKVSLGHISTSQTSQKTVPRQYVASTPPSMHCLLVCRLLALRMDAQGISLMRCSLFGWVLSSIKLTNQRNMSVNSVVDRSKTSIWVRQPSNQPLIYLNRLAEVSVYLQAKETG